MTSNTNMLVIMSDQHNKKMMGCAGHPLVKTPNLDALANRGTRFNSAYTPSPICVPARSCFATGRYVHDNKSWCNAMPYEGKQPSWGHRLQANGNEVVSIGKLHYRSEQEDTGFDKQISPMHVAYGVGDLHGAIRPDLQVRHQARKYVEQTGPGHTEYADYDRDIVAHSCDWLRRKGKQQGDKPWVLYVSFIHPHFPIVAPQEYYDMYPLDSLPDFKPADEEWMSTHPWWKEFNRCFIYDRCFRDDEHRKIVLASYLGLCSFMDDNVGKVLAALQEAGLQDTTRVVYTSDHGDNIGARRIWGKSTMHEESAGIPLIMAGPDIPENKIIETPVSLVDMYQTILDGAGAPEAPEDADLPGRSLMEIAASETQLDRTVFSEYHAAASICGAYMLRNNRYKYVAYAHDYAPELFDLIDDPEELRNLSQLPEYQHVLQSFRSELEHLLDPVAANEEAYQDQHALIEQYGGKANVLNIATRNNTPVPDGTAP